MATDDVDERLDELTQGTQGKSRTRKAAAPVAEDFAATPVGRGDAPRAAKPARAEAGSATSGSATSGSVKSDTVKSDTVKPGSAKSNGAAGDLAASERALDDGWSELAPAADSGEGPSSGLLSFYDRLRARILRAVERRGGKLGPATVRALLLVPDVFILLVRLTFDREVPGSARAMIGGALAYFILPMDLFPEAVFGAAGYVDDLVLATAVLAHAFGGELEPYARKHWSGPEDVRKVLADISGAAEGLLGKDLYARLQGMLQKRGIELDSRK